MVRNQASNDDEVLAMIMPDLKKAVDYVAQKIWNDNRELVRVIVYESYQPEKYKRTNEFREAWETDTKLKNNVASGEFRYAPNEMTIGVNGQHTSINPKEERDVRPYLAEIIYEGLSGAIYQKGYARDNGFSGAWTRKRDVWKALNKKIGKRKIEQYFEEGMNMAGIKYVKHRASIQRTEYDKK